MKIGILMRWGMRGFHQGQKPKNLQQKAGYMEATFFMTPDYFFLQTRDGPYMNFVLDTFNSH